MTKTPADQNKSVKKAAKLTSEDKNELKNELQNEVVIDEVVSQQGENVEEEDSVSSVLTDEEDGDPGIASSGEDTDQLMMMALDTIEKQATESKIVIPVAAPVAVMKEKEKLEIDQPTPSVPCNLKTAAEASDSGESSPTPAPQPLKIRTAKRKLEAEKRKLKKAKQLSKERREKIKAQVARQVTELALASEPAQALGPQVTPLPKIPKLSSERARQQKAVMEARNRIGLASKYGNLSNLVEFHRLLLKGNPFALVEPKQVYPYFHLIPGINSSVVQPLIRAWQEKATRILYQLLLVETRGDIARLKKRTLLFKAEPTTFIDAFLLKIDIGLELESDGPVQTDNALALPSTSTSTAGSHLTTNRQSNEPSQPPLKRNRKFQ